NLEVSARRIVWGKFINAGQTCIAPDYLLVEESVVERFNSLLKAEIESAYGPDPEQSPDFARIINDGHFERLKNMLDGQNIIYGGKFNPATRYVSPTLVQNPPMESGLMGEEIFGPVLPILTYRTSDDIRTIVSRYEKPLAWYVFSEDSRMIDQIVRDYPAGGICINDTVVQYANRRLPFGGIGHSGMGAYHGKRTFDTFTHYKP